MLAHLKNSLLSSWMDIHHLHIWRIPTQPQYVNMMSSQCRLVILPQTDTQTKTQPNTQTPCQQRPQPTQIIWVCPDIWFFSVLHNRHLPDIWVICQKCQFGVRKGWKALFLQLKPQEMHCKQADSATLKIYFFDSIQILQSCKIRHACMLWSERVPEENWSE